MGKNWEFRVDTSFSHMDSGVFFDGGEEVNNIARGVKCVDEMEFQEGTKVYRIGAG